MSLLHVVQSFRDEAKTRTEERFEKKQKGLTVSSMLHLNLRFKTSSSLKSQKQQQFLTRAFLRNGHRSRPLASVSSSNSSRICNKLTLYHHCGNSFIDHSTDNNTIRLLSTLRSTSSSTGIGSYNSNNNNMIITRKLLRWVMVSSPLFMKTTALPFGTRGAGVIDEQDPSDTISVIEAVVDTRNGDVIRFTNPKELAANVKRTNNIIKLYYDSIYDDSDDNTASNDLLNEIQSVVANMTDFLQSTRRVLHKHPELMYQEQFTSQTVQAVLQELDVNYTTGWAKNTHPDVFPGPGGYGIVADIGTGQQPCILLRADMDALPIFERTEGIDDFKSINDHKMHACGHDAHTTMLLGAVAVLKQIEASIPGTVRIMFQPAEEGGAGAKRMREEGVLTKYPQPQYAFGMHVWPSLPTGTIASRPGPIMAACERFEILIAGVGGHAAMPHLTIDPIVAASAMVMNLQTIVSRTISPLEAGVCSITQFDTGAGAFNVIPHSATLKGTIRSLSTETLLQLRDKVQHIVETTAAVHRCNVTISYSPDYYPVTVNDPTLYETFSADVGSLLSDEGTVRTEAPTMGAEDFAFLAETIPATFFWLGQGSGTNPPTNYGLHHPHFALDESVLPRGVELHVNLALRSIAKLLKDQQQQQKVSAKVQ